jgi:hypothetical protein
MSGPPFASFATLGFRVTVHIGFDHSITIANALTFKRKANLGWWRLDRSASSSELIWAVSTLPLTPAEIRDWQLHLGFLPRRGIASRADHCGLRSLSLAGPFT